MQFHTLNSTTLKLWRKLRNMSQKELATAIGVTRETLNRWEKGIHAIPPAIGVTLTALEAVHKVRITPNNAPSYFVKHWDKKRRYHWYSIKPEYQWIKDLPENNQ